MVFIGWLRRSPEAIPVCRIMSDLHPLGTTLDLPDSPSRILSITCLGSSIETGLFTPLLGLYSVAYAEQIHLYEDYSSDFQYVLAAYKSKYSGPPLVVTLPHALSGEKTRFDSSAMLHALDINIILHQRRGYFFLLFTSRPQALRLPYPIDEQTNR
ncbi:hypothetical protein EDB19DRAFT_683203 [Suillus lakei]|nr:hypothetical protein EDB19DRAFT_683203 [Suillus lakei]